MDYGKTLLALLRHMAMATAATLLALLLIERLMPGAVLPFIDVIDWLLPVLLLTLVLTTFKSTDSLVNRSLQTAFVVLVGLGLLAIWATRMESFNLTNDLVLVAAGLAIIAWFLGAIKPQD